MCFESLGVYQLLRQYILCLKLQLALDWRGKAIHLKPICISPRWNVTEDLLELETHFNINTNNVEIHRESRVTERMLAEI